MLSNVCSFILLTDAMPLYVAENTDEMLVKDKLRMSRNVEC